MMSVKMKVSLVLSSVLVLGATAARAQHRGPDGPPPGAPMELMGFEGMRGGKVVKGAPFSATATAETTQTLQDGSLIRRTTQVSMFRDSQGRSRHEVTLSGFGPMETSGGPKTMVMISDPVGGTHYMLDSQQKVANQLPFHAHGRGETNTDAASGFEGRMQEREQKEIAAGLLKKESLGVQTINGIVAEGTRTTHTIPAGQIGNEKPIEVVSERWYSSELQIVVKSTRTDPRFGTTTYTVTNIQRTEPAPSLFTVPSDYTVKAGGAGIGAHGGPMGVRPIN